MANKTIYIPDDEVEIYERCKAIAGKSLSSVILNALKLYLAQKDAEEKGMEKYDLWVGVEDLHDYVADYRGKRIKFVALELAQHKDDDEAEALTMRLFKTAKGKYLLHTVHHDKAKLVCNSSYAIYDDYNSLKALGLPIELLRKADKLMPDIEYEILDV